ncbi:uncharacterized protein CLUP02_07096 [Colletotrichum lupini]|uniref:Uncharacterized protein n=1 Tax=Colletotrichum lupini TaxID=145971 RepID=A0A9Q8SR98_9PEZI|nr:uncharacterized protein CLUP02_07096 [Colletotrichum lupini]UQC81610.1 hypothetical protein CLUP02_07096 [Colletotrichum lupini]
MERRTSITVRTTAVRVRKAERIPDHALPDGWAGGVCRQVAYFRKQDGQLDDVDRVRNQVMYMDEHELSSDAKVATTHAGRSTICATDYDCASSTTTTGAATATFLSIRAPPMLTWTTSETTLNLSCHGIKRILHVSSRLNFVWTWSKLQRYRLASMQ